MHSLSLVKSGIVQLFLVWSTKLRFGFSIQMHTDVPLNVFWECRLDRSWLITLLFLPYRTIQKWEVEAPILLLSVCFLRTWVLEGWMWVFASLDNKATVWWDSPSMLILYRLSVNTAQIDFLLLQASRESIDWPGKLTQYRCGQWQWYLSRPIYQIDCTWWRDRRFWTCDPNDV